MKSDQTIIRKNLMEQLNFITNLLGIKDPNIQIISLIWIPTRKSSLSFIAQDFDSNKILAILDRRTQVTIRNHFLRYSRQVRNGVKVITMDMFSPYYHISKKLFPSTKIVLDRFHIVQHISRAMSRVRVQIMNYFNRKSHKYRTIKRYWKLIQQDSQKLSDKRFYHQT